jgi:hypothetical protein
MLEVETALTIRRATQRETPTASLEKQSEILTRQRELRGEETRTAAGLNPGSNPTTASLPPQSAPHIAQEVSALGALASIRQNPTVVDPEAQRLLANYTYHQIQLPGVHVPHDFKAPREKLDDGLERRIQVQSLAMDANVRTLTSTE